MDIIFKKQKRPAIPSKFSLATSADQPVIDDYLRRIQGGVPPPENDPAWGFRLGSLSVSLFGPHLDQALRAGPYWRFLEPLGKADSLKIRFILDPRNGGNSEELIYRSVNGYDFFRAPLFTLLLNPELGIAWGFVESLEYVSLDQVMRLCAVIYAVPHNCFFVHGCGLKYHQSGYLFTGPSGAGKTTLANSSDRFQVLNDEMVMVDGSGPRPLLCGTPFSGTSLNSLYQPGQITADGLFFLRQSERDILRPVSPVQACSALGKTVFHPHFMLPSKEKALDLLLAFTSRVPAYEMEFTKSDRFLSVIDRSLGKP